MGPQDTSSIPHVRACVCLACRVAQVAPQQQMQKLRDLFFGPYPRFVVYIDAETPSTGTINRHYFVPGRPAVNKPT